MTLFVPRIGPCHSVIGARRDNFGIPEVDLMPPPQRLWADQPAVAPGIDLGVDERSLRPVPTPIALLRSLPDGDTWSGMSRRSLERLRAWFLICEDPQRRLDAQPVSTLAHQASLVRHVLTSPHLERVLIGDEVGLGKTVEAGLILRELLVANPALRILYLAPARLVSNVGLEFDRLGLGFRQWVSGEGGTATLSDPKVIASIHRAVHGAHSDNLLSTPPWDVIVVDECHHLSDWEAGGGSPRRNYQLVRDLAARQRPGARLILLSGTPHQGHVARFENLLRLLRRDGEPDSAAAGRLVFRTKDDVRDWDGNPLFPGRQVNAPTVIDLGPRHQGWLNSIHRFYGGDNVPGRRAAGWRLSQALQWATSSIQAGLGFMIRQAMRADWPESEPTLRRALAAIRPYRQGPPNEDVGALYRRILAEVSRQATDGDVDDIEESDENAWTPDAPALRALLEEGLGLLAEGADRKWDAVFNRVLAHAGQEKVVLFAQPIETVTALAGYLERRCGTRPAIIIGNQSPTERAREIDSFRRTQGPQFLVSSRAGGEGINLQISRRLVHVDVPWNPMELEQRVGRVHRFGSRHTILVDTVVVQQSREEHAYRIAREKLQVIAGTMVSADRFEALFNRVMALVPPAELSGLLADGPLAPLSTAESEALSRLVSAGFDSWRAFDQRFSAEHQAIRSLNAGAATWDDVYQFAIEVAGAEPAAGFEALRFRLESEEVSPDSRRAPALRFRGDSTSYACGDFSGMPVSNAAGEQAKPLGLNVAALTTALRAAALPALSSGAAHVRWPDDIPIPGWLKERPTAVVALVRQSVRRTTGALTPHREEMFAWAITASGDPSRLDSAALAAFMRAVPKLSIRREVEPAPALVGNVDRLQDVLIGMQIRPTEQDRADRIVHAVTPLFCGVIW